MGFVKEGEQGFKSKLPEDLEVGETLDWIGSIPSSTADLLIQVKKYAGNENNSIYMKISSDLAKQIDVGINDRILVAFNHDHSRFGIRKDSRGLKLKGSDKNIYLQHCNKAFNGFEIGTIWTAFLDDVHPMVTEGQYSCEISLDDSLLKQKAADESWDSFIRSTKASTHTYEQSH